MLTKTHVHSEFCRIVDQKIFALRADIAAAEESRNTATKSTAGDKHETGRAMLQTELENLEVQRNKAIRLRHILKELEGAKPFSKIKSGSLVQTNRGWFYIAASLGKVEICGEVIFAISAASPLGNALSDKTEGEKITVNTQEHKVLTIL